MYMSSEGQALFINYAPRGQSYCDDDFRVHAYQDNSFSHPLQQTYNNGRKLFSKFQTKIKAALCSNKIHVHTPTAYSGDDCLSREWTEVTQKLVHFARNNREENG
ncbi:hypothetical protein LOAG_08464 [Loa loa]|uniref:Uncharacterized protein n=1 Tax=Loa loa TaxID=7209 RepID=A0A1S0TTV9_LOALO|nr:hypothetical protein LOAG_08464 [Loa loa]EFO20026.1 hypothetical protein LOAG_08464 [Loa loa]